MSKSKKILSLFLAMLMICSTFTVGAQAYKAGYKDAAITEYDSIDKPVFTKEQLATMVVDYLDNMVAGISDNPVITIPIIGAEINLSSLDKALDSVQDIYTGSLWNTVKNVAGPVGEELNFNSLRYDKNDPAATGCRRYDSTQSDVAFLKAILGFLKDNATLLGEYGYGTIEGKIGATLKGLLGDNVDEYLDATNLIRGILYDEVYDTKKHQNEPDYPYKRWKRIDKDTIYVDSNHTVVKDIYNVDTMLQLLVDDLMEQLEKSLGRSFKWGIELDFSDVVKINKGSFYDVFEAVLARAYNQVLVPLGNTKFKMFFYEFIGAKNIDAFAIKERTPDAEGNYKTIGYYLDDTAAIKKLLDNPEYTCSAKKSVKQAYADGDFNDQITSVNQDLSEMLNLDYEIGTYDFTGKYFFKELNNILKVWADAIVKVDGFTWQAGSNDKLVENIVNFAKRFIVLYGEKYLGDFITIPDDPAEIEAMDFEDIVIRYGKELLYGFADNMLLPVDESKVDTVREIVTYALCELIADKVPQSDIYSKLETGVINADSDEGWKAIGAVIARYYANGYTNMNLPEGLTFEETITAAVEWALNNYGSILSYTSDLVGNKSLTAWQKLDKVIFGLIPADWLPQTMRTLDANGNVVNTNINGNSQALIMDGIIGNLLNLKIEYIFDIFDRNTSSTASLNNTAVGAVLGLLKSILNAVIDGAMPGEYSSLEALIQPGSLGGIIEGLLTGLYTSNIIPSPDSNLMGGLPLACMILDLSGEQSIEDPEITYPNQVISAGRSLNDTSITLYNASTGVNTAYRKTVGGQFIQDKLYQVKVDSIVAETTTGDKIAISGWDTNPTINGGEKLTFPVNGSLKKDGLVRFCIAYEILNESGVSLTSEPIKVYHYTYVAASSADDINENFELVNGSHVYPEYGNAHYIVNAPHAYISSWSQLRNLDVNLGRESKEGENHKLEAYITFNKVESTLTSKGFDVKSPMADDESIKTVQGGYYGSVDFFNITIPQVDDPESEDPTKTIDDSIEKYVGDYTATLTLNFGATETGYSTATAPITRQIHIYNDYDLPTLVANALRANRQEANFSSESAFNAYLEALTEAQAMILMPKTIDTFNAIKGNYEAAATKLKNAIEALDKTAASQGTDDLVNAREEIEPSNPEDSVYYDEGYNFMGEEDYVLHTWVRYKKHRKNMQALIDSQIVNIPHPGADATPEQLDEYEKQYAAAVAAIPSLKLFDVTYSKHMYQMNAERLIKRTSSNNYLNYAIINVQGRIMAYQAENDNKPLSDLFTVASVDVYNKALAFANKVTAEAKSDAYYPQTKINAARQGLIKAYKDLVPASQAPADYAAFEANIKKISSYLTNPKVNEMFEADAITTLRSVFSTYNAKPRDYLIAKQGEVDEWTNALLAAIEEFEAAKIAVALKGLGDFADIYLDAVLEETGEALISNFKYGVTNPAELLKGLGGADVVIEKTDADRDVLATGDKIKVGDSLEYTVVIFGDTNGDGEIDQFDASEMARWYVRENYWGEFDQTVYSYAGDLNGDGGFDPFDIEVIDPIANFVADASTLAQNIAVQ